MLRLSGLSVVAWVALGSGLAVQADPPASQPDVLIARLVVASATALSGKLPAEDWIAKETTTAGLPQVAAMNDWSLCGIEKPTVLDTSSLPRWQVTVQVRRDPTSGLLTIELTGTRAKSLMMIGSAGQQTVCKIDAMDSGQMLFVAFQVVPASFRVQPSFGQPVRGLQMNLRVTDWPTRGAVRFRGLIVNTSDNTVQTPMWALNATCGLEIVDSAGKLVRPQTVYPIRPNRGRYTAANALAPRGGAISLQVTADWADSTLVLVSTTGTRWTWKLPAGEYDIRAVGDFGDVIWGGANPGVDLVRSQTVRVRVPAPTSQPDKR